MVKNPLFAGDLVLPCITSNSDTLFLRQTSRLILKSETCVGTIWKRSSFEHFLQHCAQQGEVVQQELQGELSQRQHTYFH